MLGHAMPMNSKYALSAKRREFQASNDGAEHLS